MSNVQSPMYNYMEGEWLWLFFFVSLKKIKKYPPSTTPPLYKRGRLFLLLLEKIFREKNNNYFGLFK